LIEFFEKKFEVLRGVLSGYRGKTRNITISNKLKNQNFKLKN
jgi:hypothetical protein